MADTKPLHIQSERQLSRYDSLDPEEKQTGYSLKTRQHTAKYKCSGTRCLYITLSLLAALSIIATFTLWSLANTVYKSGKLPQKVNTKLGRNDTVLVGEFNPFYVDNVTFTSDDNSEVLLKRLPCSDLKTTNNTVTRLDQLHNVTNGTAYKVATFYLNKGSEVEILFNITSDDDSVNTTQREDIASVYIYTDDSKFDDFVTYGPEDKNASRVFSIGDRQFDYTLSVSEAKNYFIGMYIPAYSTVQSVSYVLHANEIRYSTEWVEPTCVLTPPTNTSCTMQFTNPHVNSDKNDICVLGKNPGDGFVKVELKSHGNSYVHRVSFILEELSLGVCAAVVVVNVFIILCIYLRKEFCV